MLRTSHLLGPLAATCALAVAGCGGGDGSAGPTTPASTAPKSAATSSTSQTTALVSTKPGPEGTPLELGAPLTASPSEDGEPKDGVQCNLTEALVYHVHAHLAIYVDGKPRALPLGIGIRQGQVQQTANGPFVGQGQCFYWLHTHATDGIIHIESPKPVQYTLSQFFAVWGQPLSAAQVGPAKGKVAAFLDGKRYTKSLGSIGLAPHAKIQLDIGTPVVKPQPVAFADL